MYAPILFCQNLHFILAIGRASYMLCEKIFSLRATRIKLGKYRGGFMERLHTKGRSF